MGLEKIIVIHDPCMSDYEAAWLIENGGPVEFCTPQELADYLYANKRKYEQTS